MNLYQKILNECYVYIMTDDLFGMKALYSKWAFCESNGLTRAEKRYILLKADGLIYQKRYSFFKNISAICSLNDSITINTEYFEMICFYMRQGKNDKSKKTVYFHMMKSLKHNKHRMSNSIYQRKITDLTNAFLSKLQGEVSKYEVL